MLLYLDFVGQELNMINRVSIFTDGGARGNPGPAAIGVFIKDKTGREIAKIGKKIGIATNNVAEYKAVIEGLEWLINNKEKFLKEIKIYFFLDSKLVYSQIVGLFKIKNAELRDLLFIIREKEAQLDLQIFYNYIPREKNKEADKLVNLALDNSL